MPTDEDGDGYLRAEDCNDQDASIHPDAVDVPYNGIDEDCDGSDLVDVDGDGWDASEVGGQDCNDINAEISPGESEHCDDGLDNDCDGSIDEGCAVSGDPNDPGGISWTCGLGAHSHPSLWSVFGLLLLIARRRGR